MPDPSPDIFVAAPLKYWSLRYYLVLLRLCLEVMASNPPQRSISLAQSVDDRNLDGSVTFEEAIANTEGLKTLQLEKPIIVHKPVGNIKVADLPAKDEIHDNGKKKLQFLDVIMGHKGAFNFKEIETLFLQQRYADLPEPLGMKGRNLTPFNMQLFILPQGPETYHIVKHIKFAENTKVNHFTILNMVYGQALEIDLQKHYREGSRAFQYMLEGLGGFQVRYLKLVPQGSSSKPTKEMEDIRKGFDFIRQQGPEENSEGQFTSWTEEQVNDPSSPLYRWERGTIKEFLRCLADQGSQANTIKDWPLTLKSITPWALNQVIAPILPHILEHAIVWIGRSHVGKSPISYTLSSITSAFWLVQEDREEPPMFQTCNHLDYFRKEKGRRTKPRVFDDGNLNLEHPASVKAVTEVSGIDRKTMARYNASSYAKNQLCQICSNPYDRDAEPPMAASMASDHVTFDTFFKIIRPSFHRDFDMEDLMGIFKRAVFVVFTDMGIYIRLPGTDRAPIQRIAWPEDDIGMVAHSARPTLAAYKKGNLSRLPPQHAQDMQWSLNLLQAALDGETVPLCSSVRGRELSTGKKFLKEVRPDLAGIPGTTFHYDDTDRSNNDVQESKRFKSVKSASALLSMTETKKEEKSAPNKSERSQIENEDEQTTASGISGSTGAVPAAP